MNDREKARELADFAANGALPWKDEWLDKFAAKARALFGSITPEEREVLDRASKYRDATHSGELDASLSLVLAVDALRASREPAPRFVVEAFEMSWRVRDTKGRMAAATVNQAYDDALGTAHRIAHLLNEDSKRGLTGEKDRA